MPCVLNHTADSLTSKVWNWAMSVLDLTYTGGWGTQGAVRVWCRTILRQYRHPEHASDWASHCAAWFAP